MKLAVPVLNLMLFAIHKYGKQKLSEKMNIPLPDSEPLLLSALNQKKEIRHKIYYQEDGTFHCKSGKLDKIGKSELWKFDNGVAILKHLSLLEKVKKFFFSLFSGITKPINNLIKKMIDDVAGNIPQPVIWLYLFVSSVLGIISSIIDTIFAIVFVIFTFNPWLIVKTIVKKVLSMLLSIILQILIAITAPFFMILFSILVDMFSNKKWFKCMIVGMLRRQFTDEEFIVVNKRDIVDVQHIMIKRRVGAKWHSVVVTEGDTNKYGLTESFIAAITPEYWRGTSHVIKVKDQEEAVSLIAFLKGTYVLK